jgi:hypothetical protein
MKRPRKYPVIYAVILVLFFSFNLTGQVMNKINSKGIQRYNNQKIFLVSYSAIIYDERGKKLSMPVFRGTEGDAFYEDIITYCINMKYINKKEWLPVFVKCRNGEVKKTFHDFLAFYKSNILKSVNINDPKCFTISGPCWLITYDFSIGNLPCYMEIKLPPLEKDLFTPQKDLKYKTVYDIIPNEEDREPGLIYTIVVGAKSSKYK